MCQGGVPAVRVRVRVQSAVVVLQAIALLDTLDKDVNTFVMRVREWYSWHFPELVKVPRSALDCYLPCTQQLHIPDKRP